MRTGSRPANNIGGGLIWDMGLTWKLSVSGERRCKLEPRPLGRVPTPKPGGPLNAGPLQRSLGYHHSSGGAVIHSPFGHPIFMSSKHPFPSANGPDGGFERESQLPELTDPDTTKLAIALLRAPSALMLLTEPEAATVVSYMRQIDYAEGDVLMREGDTVGADFVLLIIDGEVTVESLVVSRTMPSTLNVLGPGNLIGELGLIDGGPRSAHCMASGDVRCVLLTRASLTRLIDDEPRTGAKLLLAVSLYMAKRLRDSAHKLKLYARLAGVMQEEINKLMGGG